MMQQFPQDSHRNQPEKQVAHNRAFHFSETAEVLTPLVEELFAHGLTGELDERLRPLIQALDVAKDEALSALRSTYDSIPHAEPVGRMDAVFALAHLGKFTGTLIAILDQIDSDECVYPMGSRRIILKHFRKEDSKKYLLFGLRGDLERMKRLDEYIADVEAKSSNGS
ncbi:MAG: hypothetical protein KDD62_05740 [Bdellovibrionales bacterium]|nr:hypothetical protein [Bdellovibrionales bacterium]